MKYIVDRRGIVDISKCENRFTEVKSIKKLSDEDIRDSQQFIIDGWDKYEE